jgi:hypothetical protein
VIHPKAKQSLQFNTFGQSPHPSVDGTIPHVVFFRLPYWHAYHIMEAPTETLNDIAKEIEATGKPRWITVRQILAAIDQERRGKHVQEPCVRT